MNIGRVERLTKSGPQILFDADAATRTKTATPSAIMRPFSEIKPEPLKWLWPGRIPLGKLTLLVGDPGLGKSLVTIDVAARVTRGGSFPDDSACEAGGHHRYRANPPGRDEARQYSKRAKAERRSFTKLLQDCRQLLTEISGSIAIAERKNATRP